jgi:tetratricopeptide (TPR) repeat protein
MATATWEETNRMKNTLKQTLIFIVTGVLLCSAAYAQDKPDALKLYNDGKYADAEKICLDELKDTPKNMNSYAVLCWALIAEEKYKDAVLYAEKGLKVSTYDRRLLDSAARAYYHIGDNKKAINYFETFITAASTTDDVKMSYYYMGEIYIRLGEFNNADIAFTTALHFDNKQAAWWARLGYAREMAKDYLFAIEAYENALKLNPGLADAQRGLKTANEATGQ